MYKVLIAEDEILVRLGLSNSIDWKKLDMVLTSQAANGAQAYELFVQEQPDIVITDIRMPLMDGMELIRKIRETGSICKIIIITCVEEFEYARQAIAYQVEDYILKLTMDMDEIEALLSRIRTKLDGERSQDLLQYADTASADAPFRQELYDCLCGYRPAFSFNNLTASYFSAPFGIAFIRVLLAKKDNQEQSDRDKLCTDKTLFQLLKQHLEHDHAILIEKVPGDFFLLFQDMASFRKDLKDVISLTEKYYNSSPICGVSPFIRKPEETFKAGQYAQSSLAQYFFSPKSYLFDSDSVPRQEDLKADIFAHIREIVFRFRDSQPCVEAFWQEYTGRIGQFLDDCPADSEHIRKLFYYLADWLQENLNLRNSELADNCVYNYRRYIFETASISDIYYIFEHLLRKLLSLMGSVHTLSREMQKITRYIEQHYGENLTLDELSLQVNYSKGYLCSIFRRELNTSFGHYLAKVRITHAKKLLTESFLRLYEIAEQTGFYDYSHFARTFKKATGFTPQEYQNHQTAENEEVTP